MLNQFYTLGDYGEARWEEKKSLFIAGASPVVSEAEAIEFINDIKIKYNDARHHVYAYVIGENNEIQRFSDDGEPAGTGGRPVLDVIRNCRLKNTIIVVTRYFGGILLGTGGLIRAYGKSAALAVKSGGIVKKKLYRKATIFLEYGELGKVQNFLATQTGCRIKNISYTDKVTITCHIEIQRIGQVEKWLNDLYRGSGKITFHENLYETEKLNRE
ncbi:MAG: YigZ family protein [Bacillota bacterium]|jgi:uncharacterized YigZ family protein